MVGTTAGRGAAVVRSAGFGSRDRRLRHKGHATIGQRAGGMAGHGKPFRNIYTFLRGAPGDHEHRETEHVKALEVVHCFRGQRAFR